MTHWLSTTETQYVSYSFINLLITNLTNLPYLRCRQHNAKATLVWPNVCNLNDKLINQQKHKSDIKKKNGDGAEQREKETTGEDANNNE